MAYRYLAAFVALLAINVAILLSREEMKEYRVQLKICGSDILNRLSKIFTAGLSNTSDEEPENTDRLLTPDELSQYDGSSSDTIMLAVLGKVFDVSRGAKHYGPGGGYHFFAGRDASRAFVSGDFTEEGLTDDVEGLRPHEYPELESWVKFYEKDYIYVGKVEGPFYDSKGRSTDTLKKVNSMIAKGKELKEEDEADKTKYPMCNSEWSQDKGGMVYCSQKSGGIERDWVGVPRLYFRPGIHQPRCACVKTTGPPSDDPGNNDHKNRGDLDLPNFKRYPNCDSESVACRIPEN